MTKRKAYKEATGSDLQTQRAIDNVYVNALEVNIPAAKENSSQNTLYESLDLSSMQTTMESPGRVSKETPIRLTASAVRSIRCLQVVCVVLVVIIIAMAATVGFLLSEQKERTEATEGNLGLLKSEMKHKQYDLQQLRSQITQMTSDQKVLTTVFRQLNDTIRLDKAENHATLQSYNIRITDNYATNQNQSMSITQLKTGQNNVSEILHNQNSRITAIEGSSSIQPMIAFTAIGRKNVLNGALVYSRILSEVGGGFDTSTGVFTCPVAGLYLVSIMLQVESDGHINCWLYKNGAQTWLEIDINGNGQELASQTAVLKLRQGDSLYIGSCNESNVGDETSFTVALIQAGA